MNIKRAVWLVAGLWATTAIGWAGEPVRLDWGDLDTAGAVRQSRFLSSKTAGAPPAHIQRKNAQGAVPWLVQCDGIVQEEWKAALQSAGAILKSYVPENAFLIEATPEQMAVIQTLPGVAWAGEYLPEYKRSRLVRARLATGRADAVDYSIVLFRPEETTRMADAIASLPGAAILQQAAMTDRGLVRATLTPSLVEEIASWAEVEWIEPYIKPRLWNDVAVRANKMNVSAAWTNLGLTGAGQIIAVCDTGLDSGNTNTIHPDFTNRIVWAQALGRAGNWSDTDSHGTHVAGSVLGSGVASTGRYRGVAFEAKLVMQSVLDSGGGLGGLPADLNVLFRAAFTNGARIHSDSWGTALAGSYDVDARNLDMFVWSNKTMLVIVAAGNEGVDANADGVVDLDSMSTPATAKNGLTVGAAENYRTSGGYSTYTWGTAWPSDYSAAPISTDPLSSPDSPQGMAAFSSRGPCDDGRIKPDIVAPGTDIISTRSRASTDTGWGLLAGNTNYMFMGGTSMATPLTAGAAGLVREWLATSRAITNPSAALIKALMINGARNMAPGQYGTGVTQEIPSVRPNNVQGYGHVDLFNTLSPPVSHVLSLLDTNSLSTGQTNTFMLFAEVASTNRCILTLAYSDYFAASGSGKKLVNDLDLRVQKPSGAILYPNGRTSPDATNNVEMIEFAPDETGAYTVSVVGRTVPSGGTQPFALVIRGPVSVDPPPSPPVFDAAGPLSAVTAVPTSITIRATGFPIPGIVLSAASVSSGYSFNPATGVLAYTPSFTDVGAQSFVFVATNTEGVATQSVAVTVALGVPASPNNLRVETTNQTDAAIAWDAADGAESYRIDVHTFIAFDGTIPGATNVETFTDIGASSASYTDRLWTNNGVVWFARRARTDYTIDGRAIGLRGTSDAFIQSGTLTGGVDEISIVHRRNTGSAATFDIFVNTTKVADAVSMSTLVTTTRVTGINMSGDFTLMVTNGGANVARLDNLTWVGLSTAGGTFVDGFSNRLVSGTSMAVTGLVPGATYYLRVRAANAAGASPNTPTVSFLTSTGVVGQTIFFAPVPDQLATHLVGLAATASSGLPVSFAVASGPALLNGGTNLSFTGAGEVEVVASQPGDETWPAAANVTNWFLVTKAPASVELSDLGQIYDGTPRVVGASTAPTGLAVVVTYEGGTNAPVNAGEYVVQADIDDARHAGSSTGLLQVAQALPFLAWNNPSAVVYGTPLGDSQLNATSSVAGSFVYAPASGVVLNAGTTTLQAVFSPIDAVNYSSSTISVALVVEKAPQTITFDPPGDQVATNTVILTASSGSGLPVVFAVASGPASIDDVQLSFTGAGDVAVAASQAGDANWLAAATVTNAMTVTKASAMVDLFNLAQTYDGEEKSVGYTTDPVGLDVEVVYDGVPLNASEYGVAASIADSLYAGGTTGTLVIVPAVPAIAWSNPVASVYGQPLDENQLNATSSVEGVITYDPPTGTILNAGTSALSAVFAPSDALNYVSATATVALIIQRAPQSIAFADPGAQVYTNVVVLSATADSGLPVAFGLLSGPGALDGAMLTFVGAGVVEVEATQAGDTNWLAAPPVVRSIEVLAFADVNTNSLPDEWEMENFGSLEVASPDADSDGDTMTDYEEFIAGTHPANSNAFLGAAIIDITPQEYRISWPSSSNRIYSIQRAPTAYSEYLTITSGLSATPPNNSFFDDSTPPGVWFYRIVVEPEAP